MNDDLAVILFGDLHDGYMPVGPFKTMDDAFEWLEKNNKDHWPIGWVMSVINPKEFAEHMKENEEETNEEPPGTKNDN